MLPAGINYKVTTMYGAKDENEFSFEELIANINSICYSQAEEKNVNYECEVSPNIEESYIGDEMKLQQVLVNILANAVKFTSAGGRVSMNVRQMGLVKKNAMLRFIINDTGCGISEEFIPRLFDPFAQENSGSTTNYGGTGLGLAISKNIVDLMCGHIYVRSIMGVGSEFTVDVKLEAAEETQLSRSNISPNRFAKLKTLIVDDDVTVC